MNEIILSSAEGAAYGVGTMALYSVIGFILVIAVLIILILLLVAFAKILNAIPVKGEKKKETTAAPVSLETDVNAEEDGEIVAAITAALMAYYDGGKAAGSASDADDMPVPFVIRSIKKS